MPQSLKTFGAIPEDLGKSEIADLGTLDAEQLISAGADVCQSYLELRRYQAYLDAVGEALKASLLAEAPDEPYSSGKAVLRCQTRTTYRYAEDPRLHQLTTEGNEIKHFIKSHQTFLQSITGEYEDVADEDTGEVTRYYAPEREETQMVVVRL